jgi:hypothetical protein
MCPRSSTWSQRMGTPSGMPSTITKFLVFGNDCRVPLLWLERYGGLVSDIAFYFLTDDGELEEID